MPPHGGRIVNISVSLAKANGCDIDLRNLGNISRVALTRPQVTITSFLLSHTHGLPAAADYLPADGRWATNYSDRHVCGHHRGVADAQTHHGVCAICLVVSTDVSVFFLSKPLTGLENRDILMMRIISNISKFWS